MTVNANKFIVVTTPINNNKVRVQVNHISAYESLKGENAKTYIAIGPGHLRCNETVEELDAMLGVDVDVVAEDAKPRKEVQAKKHRFVHTDFGTLTIKEP